MLLITATQTATNREPTTLDL